MDLKNLDYDIPTSDELPNPDSIMKIVNKIKIRVKEMNNTDLEFVTNKIKNEYPNFSESYPTLINMIVRGDDLKHLRLMLDMINQIKVGNTDYKNASVMIGQTLKNEYVSENPNQ